MPEQKKSIKKQINSDELERILWLRKGINAIQEKGRRAVLEKDKHFMEKEAKYLSPEEFQILLFSKNIKEKDIPKEYQTEMERYQKILSQNMSDILDVPEIKYAKIGKMLGIPNAKENLFELKRDGKSIGFVHLKRDDKTLDFIQKLDNVPSEFKKKLKKK